MKPDPEETLSDLAIEEASNDPDHMRVVEHLLAHADEYRISTERQAHILAVLLGLEKKGLVERNSEKITTSTGWRLT